MLYFADKMPIGQEPLFRIIEPYNVWIEKSDNLTQDIWNVDNNVGD